MKTFILFIVIVLGVLGIGANFLPDSIQPADIVCEVPDEVVRFRNYGDEGGEISRTEICVVGGVVTRLGWEYGVQTVVQNAVPYEAFLYQLKMAHVSKSAARFRLANIAATLRDWESDAVTVVENWDSYSQMEISAIVKTLVTRFGKLSGGFADIFLAEYFSE